MVDAGDDTVRDGRSRAEHDDKKNRLLVQAEDKNREWDVAPTWVMVFMSAVVLSDVCLSH